MHELGVSVQLWEFPAWGCAVTVIGLTSEQEVALLNIVEKVARWSHEAALRGATEDAAAITARKAALRAIGRMTS